MNIKELSKILKESNNIVFFGGAGMSTESGIADFRSENGLYKTANGEGYPLKLCYLTVSMNLIQLISTNFIKKR